MLWTVIWCSVKYTGCFWIVCKEQCFVKEESIVTKMNTVKYCYTCKVNAALSRLAKSLWAHLFLICLSSSYGGRDQSYLSLCWGGQRHPQVYLYSEHLLILSWGPEPECQWSGCLLNVVFIFKVSILEFLGKIRKNEWTVVWKNSGIMGNHHKV